MDEQPDAAKDYVAVILALALGLSLFVVVVAVMYDAVRSDTPGLSENATQILTGWGGGIIGILGGYVGYRAGSNRKPNQDENEEP